MKQNMKVICYLLACLLSLVCPLQANYNVSIGAIFQDDAPYLKEWIDYHRKIGVEHFWLYNNNSVDNFREVLNPYIEEGTVTLIEWPSVYAENEFVHFCFTVQVEAYNDAIARAKNVSKWLALIDTDEFIVPMVEDNLFVFLEKYYWYVSGLCVNWQTYGTSHVEKVGPDESMLKQLVWKMPWNHPRNQYHKSIVQPLDVSHCDNPHQCIYLPGHFHVTPTLERVVGPCSSGVYIDLIRLNHYWARDEWFLNNIKIPRRVRWGVSPAEAAQDASGMNVEKDECIFRLLD